MPAKKKMVVSTETLTRKSVRPKVARAAQKQIIQVEAEMEPVPASPSPPPSEVEAVPASPTPSHAPSLDIDDAVPTFSQKKKKTSETHLTDEQEISVAEWLRDNSFLYNKGAREYRDAVKKTAMWQGQAEKLGVDVVGLKIWFKSVRTKLGKITKGKSGQPAKPRTERDIFIMANFGFLLDHIVRMPSKTAGKLATATQAQAPESIEGDDDDSQADPTDSTQADPIESTQPVPSQPAPSQPAPSQPGPSQPRLGERARGKKRSFVPDPENTQDLVAKIARQQKANEKLDSDIRGVLDFVQVPEQASWATWMGTVAQSLHPNLMTRFYTESFAMMINLRKDSEQLYQAEAQRQQSVPVTQTQAESQPLTTSQPL